MSAEALFQAVEALRRGRWAEGEALLAAALAAGLEPALQGRAHGMRGQALLEIGRLEEAKIEVQAAMRAAKAEGDSAGLEALRALNARLYARLAEAAEQARLRAAEALEVARPLAELLAEAATDDERAMVYVRKGRAEADPVLARQALALARSPREKVLALLLLHELGAEPRALHQARDVADEAEEPQLLTAVARAARAAGVELD